MRNWRGMMASLTNYKESLDKGDIHQLTKRTMKERMIWMMIKLPWWDNKSILGDKLGEDILMMMLIATLEA